MSDLRVTNLRGRTAGTPPTLPDGVIVTGIATATTFDGNATGISGTPNITVGFLTATDVWVSGAVTATTYHGSGANLTGIAGGVAGINTVGLSTFKDILVSGISTFKGDVLWDNSTNAGKDILWDESDNSLNFSENVSIKLNDSSGGQNASLSNGGWFINSSI